MTKRIISFLLALTLLAGLLAGCEIGRAHV